jgi:hypothetical protein
MRGHSAFVGLGLAMHVARGGRLAIVPNGRIRIDERGM